jgi:uncharacterized protein YigE (DUF2233 family)
MPGRRFRKALFRSALLATAVLASSCSRSPAESPAVPQPPAPAGAWRSLETGLALGEFRSPRLSDVGDSMVRVLRIDPAHFDLRLMNASSSAERYPMTAAEWARRHDLVAAINPSMYQEDHSRSVSLMRTRSHVNNSYVSKDRTVLAFDRLDDTVPPVQIIDRDCQDFDELRQHYGTLVQSIRMVSCEGHNVWSQQPRKWSTAAIGIDHQGRVLFIHVRSPFSTHDLIRILQELPLDLYNAMYTEGGPEAQLYLRTGGEEMQFVGSFETGFVDSDDNVKAWPVPNIVGVVRRDNLE